MSESNWLHKEWISVRVEDLKWDSRHTSIKTRTKGSSESFRSHQEGGGTIQTAFHYSF